MVWMSFPIKRSRSYIYSIAKVTSQCHWTSIKPPRNNLTFQTVPVQFIQSDYSTMLHCQCSIQELVLTLMILFIELLRLVWLKVTIPTKPTWNDQVFHLWFYNERQLGKLKSIICKWKKSEFIFGILYIADIIY